MLAKRHGHLDLGAVAEKGIRLVERTAPPRCVSHSSKTFFSRFPVFAYVFFDHAGQVDPVQLGVPRSVPALCAAMVLPVPLACQKAADIPFPIGHNLPNPQSFIDIQRNFAWACQFFKVPLHGDCSTMSDQV